jgi:threonine dehydratase
MVGGRVLLGLQAAPQYRVRLDAQFAALGYPYEKETANDAYRLFLRG